MQPLHTHAIHNASSLVSVRVFFSQLDNMALQTGVVVAVIIILIVIVGGITSGVIAMLVWRRKKASEMQCDLRDVYLLCCEGALYQHMDDYFHIRRGQRAPTSAARESRPQWRAPKANIIC